MDMDSVLKGTNTLWEASEDLSIIMIIDIIIIISIIIIVKV